MFMGFFYALPIKNTIQKQTFCERNRSLGMVYASRAQNVSGGYTAPPTVGKFEGMARGPACHFVHVKATVEGSLRGRLRLPGQY